MDLGIYEIGGARNILVHLIAAHPREVIEELVMGVTTFQIVK
jgi:hypothetical protein